MNEEPTFGGILQGDGVLHMDGEELAVRIIEALSDMPRPEGLTPREILEAAEETEVAEVAHTAVLVAFSYFQEVLTAQPGFTKLGKRQ